MRSLVEMKEERRPEPMASKQQKLDAVVTQAPTEQPCLAQRSHHLEKWSQLGSQQEEEKGKLRLEQRLKALGGVVSANGESLQGGWGVIGFGSAKGLAQSTAIEVAPKRMLSQGRELQGTSSAGAVEMGRGR